MATRSDSLLVAAVLGMAALVGAWLWLVPAFERAPTAAGPGRSPSIAGGQAGMLPMPSLEVLPSAAREERKEQPSVVVVAAEPESTSTAPAIVAGRLRIDGSAPSGGWLRLRSVDGSWGSSAALDSEGRFWLDRVPSRALVLRFELESAARALVLPDVPLTPRAGTREELELDWRTRHVNVRVLAEDGLAERGPLEVEGPLHRARLETDAEGKASLSLVGAGQFLFSVARRDGSRGEAALELEDGDELESVLIRTRRDGG